MTYKRLLVLILPLFFGLMLTACSKPATTEAEQKEAAKQDGTGLEKLVLRYNMFPGLGGNIVSYPELAEDLGYFAPLKLEYAGITYSGPQDLQGLITGDVDVATAFNGALIKLAASGVPIVSLVGSYGSDENTALYYYVPEDSPIKTARDLIGKKVAVNTLGAHAEFTIKEYLYRNGLTKEEVGKVELVVIPPVSAEQALRAGQIDVSQLAGIIREKALERGGLRKLVSDIDMFGALTMGNYVVTKKFLKENPNSARKFTEGVARAIEWARITPRDEVVARYKSIINKRARNENDEPLKYWRSTGISSTGGVIDDQQFQLWIDWLIRDGELKPNQLNAHDLYDNRYNPYAKDAAKTALVNTLN